MTKDILYESREKLKRLNILISYNMRQIDCFRLKKPISFSNKTKLGIFKNLGTCFWYGIFQDLNDYFGFLVACNLKSNSLNYKLEFTSFASALSFFVQFLDKQK